MKHTAKHRNQIIQEILDIYTPIEIDVIRMMGNQSILKELVEFSKDNNKIGKNNSFWDYLKESYIALMVSAVCRQVDTDERSSSLINLLSLLLKTSINEQLTKKWYCAQHAVVDEVIPGFSEGYAENDFEENFGEGEHLDATIVSADRARLLKATKSIKKFRNKRIAHRDSNDELIFGVSFSDLDKSIETVREITSKYYRLIKQGGNTLIPTDQTDWQEIFTIPWIE